MLSLLSLPLLAPLLLSSSSAVQAAVAPPSTAANIMLQALDAQYVNEGFDNADVTRGFGVPLKAQAVVTVVYPGGNVVQGLGQALTKDQASTLPSVYITPSSASASNFTTSSTFTLMLADASSVGHPDPQGNFRHYLANSINPGQPLGNSDGNLTSQLSGGQTVTSYAGPGPNAGEGPHRYAWLVFAQPSTFEPPTNLSQPNTSPSHWSVSQYVRDSGLGDLVGAAWFTVENGQASFSVQPTSTVNPLTLPAASESVSSGVQTQLDGLPGFSGVTLGGSARPTGSATGSAPGSTSSGGGSSDSAAGRMANPTGSVIAVAAAVGAAAAAAGFGMF